MPLMWNEFRRFRIYICFEFRCFCHYFLCHCVLRVGGSNREMTNVILFAIYFFLKSSLSLILLSLTLLNLILQSLMLLSLMLLSLMLLSLMLLSLCALYSPWSTLVNLALPWFTLCIQCLFNVYSIYIICTFNVLLYSLHLP